MWQKICLTVLFILVSVNICSAGNRVALVIGNGAYVDNKEWRTLRNPPNDAAAVSNALRKLGFTVFVHTNLAKAEMRSVIAEFGRSAYQAEVALFFFAGHGIQNKSQNFLMPTDVRAYSLADAVDQGVNLNFALEELDNAQSQIKIVLLDACRENPYSNEYRGNKSGLAPVDVTNNMIIVYSTQPGNIAADRVGGGNNSPFTSSLVAALQGQDLSLGNVLKVTSKLVKQKTGKQQVPYVNGPRDLDDFMLAGAAGNGSGVDREQQNDAGAARLADIEQQNRDAEARLKAKQAELDVIERRRLAAEERARLAEAKARREVEVADSARPIDARPTGKLISGRYRDNGDGTVTDVTTKLMWKRCAEGQTWTGSTCAGASTEITWHDAMPNEQQKTWDAFAGYSDWRMPTIKNLRTLVYCSSGTPKTWNDANTKDFYCNGDYKKPTIDTTAFPNTEIAWFWSASAVASDFTSAWYLHFNDGGDDNGWVNSSDAGRVRLVRVGQ